MAGRHHPESFELFACSSVPLPRTAAPNSGYTGATPINSICSTSSSIRTTILAWDLCVYDPPRRRAAPRRAGTTAESFELLACSSAPPPRAVAPSSSYTRATPTNPLCATSSSTRTTILAWGLCVYDPPRRRAAPRRADITAESRHSHFSHLCCIATAVRE